MCVCVCVCVYVYVCMCVYVCVCTVWVRPSRRGRDTARHAFKTIPATSVVLFLICDAAFKGPSHVTCHCPFCMCGVVRICTIQGLCRYYKGLNVF